MQKFNEQGQKFKLYNLVAAALLVAISVILAPLNLYIPLFGVSSLRFSFTDIPVFVSGALFGPVVGIICGFLADILGFFLAPAGPYFFGFTLNKMVIGMIPGIIFSVASHKKQIRTSVIRGINLCLLVLTVLGSFFYVGVFARADIAKLPISQKIEEMLHVPMHVLLCIVIVVVATIIGCLAGYLGRKVEGIELVIFAVSINYMIVSLMLSPIWLEMLYNVPRFASFIARIFKSIIDVPLQVACCYTILLAVPAQARKRKIC